MPLWMRLFVFVPALMGSLGAFSGLYKVCPGIASKGMRMTEEAGETPIADPKMREAAKCASAKVYLSAFSTALAVTVATLIV